jgi:hypothetical protein
MTLAEEFVAGDADREAATAGFSIWRSPTRGVVLVEAWAPTRDGIRRLAFPDGSIVIRQPNGQEEASHIHDAAG